jgi:hypothetical protein
MPQGFAALHPVLLLFKTKQLLYRCSTLAKAAQYGCWSVAKYVLCGFALG